MGGFCDSDPDPIPTTTTIISGTEIPEWVSQGGERLFGEAENLARNDYQPFGGPRIAGFESDEGQAFDLARSNIGNYGANISGAGDFIERGTGLWTDPGVAESYINPYTAGVTDIAAREVERRNFAALPERSGRAVGAGAFGGAAHGVQIAENRRNLDQQLSDIYLRGNERAYESGAQRFASDQQRQLQGAGALGGLGALQQQLGQGDVASLLGVGGLQRGLAQSSLDTGYSDFLEQREWPYRQLNFALGALSGVPYEVQQNQTTQGQTVIPGTSGLQTVAGLGLAGAGIYSLLKP